jgi:hypothetical protein
MTHHQFSLFGHIKPSFKVPISAARIKEAKALLARGDPKGSVLKMREVREALERFESKL